MSSTGDLQRSGLQHTVLHHTELDPEGDVPFGHLDVTLLRRLPDEDRRRPPASPIPASAPERWRLSSR